MIPTKEQRALVRQQLAERKHAKLLLKTDQPAAYIVVLQCFLLLKDCVSPCLACIWYCWFSLLGKSQCLRRVILHIRRARRLVIGEMDCDELIDELMSVADPQGAAAGLAEGTPPAAAPTATPYAPQEDKWVQKHRERLAAIAAGDQAGQYGLVVRGKAFTAEQIDALDNSEIEKLYVRYEARLGAAMTKTLGSAALQLYAWIAAMFLQIENQPRLIVDLESDLFVGHALSSATCELYHRYGMFLAQLTAALTTLKHCDIYDGGDDVAKQQGDGGGASTKSSSGNSYGES